MNGWDTQEAGEKANRGCLDTDLDTDGDVVLLPRVGERARIACGRDTRLPRDRGGVTEALGVSSPPHPDIRGDVPPSCSDMGLGLLGNANAATNATYDDDDRKRPGSFTQHSSSGSSSSSSSA